MTTAFLAEVDTKEGTMYVGRKAKLMKLPYFWRSGSQLMSTLIDKQVYPRTGSFNWVQNAEKTSIVLIEDLHKGLRSSKGTSMTVWAFKQHRLSQPAAKRNIEPKNSVYKLLVPNLPGNKKFMGPGKFGKSWESAGALRNHLTLNIDRLKKMYANAKVVRITYNDDGITQKEVQYFPVESFYRSSPYSAKTYLNFYGTSLSQFEVPAKLPTEYA
jgi:hypothetical protein